MSSKVMAMLLGLAAASCRLETEPPSEPTVSTTVSTTDVATSGDEAPSQTQRLAPDFSLASHDGRTVTLDELVARGPAVLVFYRGHW